MPNTTLPSVSISSNFQARKPYPPPTHSDFGASLPKNNDSYNVHFRHPGYPDTNNILLVLPALDSSEGGIHHETARIACSIIANCNWEGFLTETRKGRRIATEADSLLTLKNYYFRIKEDPDDDPKYPIIPSFAHFQFPHDNLPPFWKSDIFRIPRSDILPRQSGLTETLLSRDVSCRVTSHTEGTEAAHLIPRSEEPWFSSNMMFQYTSRPATMTDPTDDARNAMLLRSDIHTVFDQKRLVAVPKGSSWVVHVFAPGLTGELTKLYHNVTLQPLMDVSVECLFARFAWTVLAQSTFLRQGVSRRLILVEGEDGSSRIHDASGDKCRLIFAAQGVKSRSQSPKKRQRDDILEDLETCSEDFRGRKRRRSFDHKSSSFGSSFQDDYSTSEEDESGESYSDGQHRGDDERFHCNLSNLPKRQSALESQEHNAECNISA